MLQDIQGIVRSLDEDTFLFINTLIAAETCVTVRLWSQLVGDKNSLPLSPSPLSGMSFHRDFNCMFGCLKADE